jgi:protein-L-isoaspartate(D-aspartate) O-methyltransferase
VTTVPVFAGGFREGGDGDRIARMAEGDDDRRQKLARMVRVQMQERGIRDDRLLEAVRRTPRDLFVPEEFIDLAYADRPLPIGHHQTISQPYIVALMLQHLSVKPDHRVLEIGTGSGWQTGLLSLLCAEVFTVERIKPLLDRAWNTLMGLDRRNVRFKYADGTAGWEDKGPFDRITLGAAPQDVPGEMLASQLAEGGIAVLPVGDDSSQLLVRVEKTGGRLRTHTICAVRFVPLVSESLGPADAAE